MKKDIRTVWALFECQGGNRWTEVPQAAYLPGGKAAIHKTGDVCPCEGCAEAHTITLLDCTFDMVEALAWTKIKSVTKAK